MNSNGQTRNNNFIGDVLINGDLTVTGTINGGGSGVNNPMTEDLDAAQFALLNVSEIAGFEGVLRTNQLDLQDNDIINLNELKGNSGDNKLVVSANVEMSENLNMTGNSIININELKCLAGSEIKTSILNLQNNNIIGVNSVHLNLLEGISNTIAMYGAVSIIGSLNLLGFPISNVATLTAHVFNGPTLNLDLIPLAAGTANQVLARDPNYSPGNPSTHKLVWQTPAGVGTVTNPLTSNLNCNSFSLTTCNNMETKNISSSNGLISINSTMIHTDNVNMNNNSIYNIGGTTITYNNIDLKLDLCPATQGLPSYVLTRDPAFNPADPNTYKLVWREPSTSGVNNPMTEALVANNNNITAVNILDTKKITNTTNITISTPTLTINNGVNLTPTAIGITGNIIFTNASATIENVGGLIIDISRIKNSGSPIIVSDIASFSQGIKSNTLDSVDGGSMSILQSLTMAVNKQFKSPLMFTDGLRSYTTDLLIAGLLPDNKTQKNILITAPIITLNNQFDPLIPESCQIKILGTVYFDNVITDSIIRGGYITIDSKYTNNTATPLYLKGSEMEITSSINDIKISVPVSKYINLQGNVLVGDGKTSQLLTDFIYPRTGSTVTTSGFNVLRKLQSNMADLVNTTRNVRTTLFKYYGSNTLAATSLNTITPVLITTSNGSSTGSKAWTNAADLVSGDKLCLTLTGILTTGTGGNMNIFVYGGLAGSLVQVTTFTTTNMSLNNEVVKITIDMDVIVSPGNFTINNVAFCTFIRNSNSTINMVGTIGSSIPLNGSPIIEIYASHTVSNASTFKLLTYSMEVY